MRTPDGPESDQCIWEEFVSASKYSSVSPAKVKV